MWTWYSLFLNGRCVWLDPLLYYKMIIAAPKCPGMAAGAVSLRKSHDIVILSFCNIVKGQANCINITKVITIEVNTKVNIIIVLLNRDVVVLLKSLPSFITRYCIPSRNMCVQNFYDCCKVLEHFMTACGSNLNILQIGVIILPPRLRKPSSSSQQFSDK